MKSVVWLPSARRDCQAFVVRTKVVVQRSSQCAVTPIYKQLRDAVHISIVMACDGLLD